MTPRTIERTDHREGPLTATPAGERIGESATTCSFNLRTLARYELVEPLLGCQQQPELRPEGSRPVMLIDLAFTTGE